MGGNNGTTQNFYIIKNTFLYKKTGNKKMDLTLKNLAEKYGTNKPTMTARVKKLEQENPEKTLTVKRDNTIYLTQTGLKLLQENIKEKPFGTKKRSTKKSKKTDTKNTIKNTSKNETKNTDISNELLKALKDQLDRQDKEIQTLKDQLETKDRQINKILDTLNQTLTQSQYLTGQAQTIINQDRITQELNEPPTETPPSGSGQPAPQKKSLFARLIVAGKILTGRNLKG